MNDWLHSIPVVWLAVIVFAVVLLMAAVIYALVSVLGRGERGSAFKAVSPGLLPPMALIFGLLVGFLAAQVWSDASSARAAVNREASSLRAVVLLSHAFPAKDEAKMQSLIADQIHQAVTREWPDMAEQHATLAIIPAPLANALNLALSLPARSPGQIVAQREIVAALQGALDARRQRIIQSQSEVNWAKWTAVLALGALTLISIALVHSGNRRSAAIALGLFASAVAVSVVVIAVQDRPFSGTFRITPEALVQVNPTAAER